MIGGVDREAAARRERHPLRADRALAGLERAWKKT